MNKNLIKMFVACSVLVFAWSSYAQDDVFRDGPTIQGFGKTAIVPSHTLSSDATFKHAFDVGTNDGEGKLNRKFDSLARFINMHTREGVNKDNIHLALVIHGGAIFDLMTTASYEQKYGVSNPNEALLKVLMENNVQVILCGQSAAARGLKQSDIVEGIHIELSAMTSHALLQQDGYSVNPF